MTKQGGLFTNPEYANFDFYLTYLSPQLITAAVHREALARGFTTEEEEQLLRDVNQRLLTENSMVFILYMKTNNPDLGVNLSPVKQNIHLLPIGGPVIPPSKYEPLFDTEFDMRAQNGTRFGYLFFPLSNGCSNGQLVNAVDPSRLASVSVKIDNARVAFSNAGPSWTFNLVPVDLGLEEALRIPDRQTPPSQQNLTLDDWANIGTIVSTVLDVWKFFKD
jgi:hypothetical protein